MTLTSVVRNFAKKHGFEISTSSNGKEFFMNVYWSFQDFGTIAYVKMSEKIRDEHAEVITNNGKVKVCGANALALALEKAWAD